MEPEMGVIIETLGRNIFQGLSINLIIVDTVFLVATKFNPTDQGRARAVKNPLSSFPTSITWF
jgi:hypothetical protein